MDGTLSPSTAPLLPTLSISPPTVVFPLSFPISMSSSPSDMASYLKTTELEWTFLTQISLCLDNPIFTDLAIKQHNTSFYLTASQYYLSFERTRGTRPLYAQFLTATRNRDCTWSLKTRDGLFVSLNPNYTYLMLSEQVDDFSRFKFIKKDSYLWIQSASSG